MIKIYCILKSSKLTGSVVAAQAISSVENIPVGSVPVKSLSTIVIL
jgi:hypothetical protein